MINARGSRLLRGVGTPAPSFGRRLEAVRRTAGDGEHLPLVNHVSAPLKTVVSRAAIASRAAVTEWRGPAVHCLP